LNEIGQKLVAAGFIAAIGWRLELEFHGWKGLDWLGFT
jgi:hypothetical protein